MEIGLRKDRWKRAQNYVLYYGHGKAESLSRYDVAIIEPKGATIDDIQYLKSQHTLVITYISIMEVHPTEPIFQQLRKEDFLIVNDSILQNKEFGTYLMNLQSQRVIQYLLQEVNHRFVTLDADGIFMDTIGDVERTDLPKKMLEEQLTAILNFLSVLRMLYPDHLLIQNNGLEQLCLQTAPYIDGICWENPPFTLPESQEWTSHILTRLVNLSTQWNLKILLLLEETIEKQRKAYPKAKTIAKHHGFLLYTAPKNYIG